MIAVGRMELGTFTGLELLVFFKHLCYYIFEQMF